MKNLPYYFREALANFLRGGLLTAAAVLSVTISMLVVGTILVLYVNLQEIYNELTAEITLEAYIEDDAVKDGLVDGIGEHLGNLDGVIGLEYISKEDAAEDFAGFFPAERRAMEEVGENPLPASYRLKLERKFEDPAMIEALAEKVIAVDGIEEVDYGREWLTALSKVVKMVRLIGIIIASVLGVASVLVVVSTIGLGVYARREQISIMKLVGATDAFVRIPFLFEGIAIGLVGSGIAVGLLYGGYFGLSISDMDIEFLPWQYIAGYVTSGAILGVIGSYIAVIRYLKV
ncbi:MAG: ABC transporter permease [bacterium]|nr:ABC transporter permease [bacterium]